MGRRSRHGRGGGGGHEGGGERWLVSYADFITLLFAFFVVMYALSRQDVAKLKAAAESIRQAFGGGGGPGYTSGTGTRVDGVQLPGPPGNQARGLPADAQNAATGGGATGAPAVPPVVPPIAALDPELEQMRELILETLKLGTHLADAGDKLETLQDARGLVVRLAADDFFGKGEAEVKADFRPVLERIGRVVASSPRAVRVEGHADEGEAAGARGYASSWELSSARAAWVVRYWLRTFKVNPDKISIQGFGHRRPLSTGKSEKARGRNRRIEIVFEKGV